MKQRSICPGRLSSAIAMALLCFPPFSSGQENPGTVYQFNDGFIVGSREKVDLSRFSASAISEGTYSLDVYTNNEWKGRYELQVTAIKTATWGSATPKRCSSATALPRKSSIRSWEAGRLLRTAEGVA
jgi:outer membrane usher protein